MRVDRCLIDSGFQAEVVYSAVRSSVFANVIYPSKGFAISARGNPFSDWVKKPGEKFGINTVVSPVGQGRMLAKYDTNYWKSFVRARLQTAPGDSGAVTFYGRSPGEHATLAAHLTAEYSIRTIGRGRKVDEWTLLPSKPDNHWFDCLVGCAAAASIAGCSLAAAAVKRTPKQRVPLGQMGR